MTTTTTIKKKYFEQVFVICFMIIFAVIIALFNFSLRSQQQFSELANSFLNFQPYFLDNSFYTKSIADTVFFNNHYYWPLGPLPAIILMPFVAIGKFIGFCFYQGYLNFFLVIFTAIIIFRICKKINYPGLDSVYWVIAFIGGSMFLGVTMDSYSWYFSQVITVLLSFLAILEYLGKKRYGLIGLLCGLILLTRVTAAILIIFFILEIITNQENLKNKIRFLLQLSIFPTLSLATVIFYNYIRFNNFFETGYTLQYLENASLAYQKNMGIFKPRNIPGNLYYSLLNPPSPVFENNISHALKFPFIKADLWGMSIFITSPYLIYIFFLRHKDKISKIAIITIILTFVPILMYYGIGYMQFGYRYALDFMPLLFFLLIRNHAGQHKNLSFNLRVIIILSSILNLYLYLTSYYVK